MTIEYKEHQFIKPEQMFTTPPTTPSRIVRVWYTDSERPDRLGFIEYAIDEALIFYLKGQARADFVRSEIVLVIQMGQEELEMREAV